MRPEEKSARAMVQCALTYLAPCHRWVPASESGLSCTQWYPAPANHAIIEYVVHSLCTALCSISANYLYNSTANHAQDHHTWSLQCFMVGQLQVARPAVSLKPRLACCCQRCQDIACVADPVLSCYCPRLKLCRWQSGSLPKSLPVIRTCICI